MTALRAMLLTMLPLFEPVAFAGGAKYQVTLAVVTDWQTVQAFGGPAAAQVALQQRIELASRVFEEQIGLQLVPTVWTIPTGPAGDFPHTDTQPNILLNYLVEWREASAQQCQQGMTILMTTRPLTDSVYGIANVNSACWGQAAGIVEVNAATSGEDWQIFAHEVGHILGATHDGDPAGSCPNEPQGVYLMTPESYRNVTQEFSPCSVRVITADITNETHPCITAAVPTAAPASIPSPPTSASGGKGTFDWLTALVLVLAAASRPLSRPTSHPLPRVSLSPATHRQV